MNYRLIPMERAHLPQAAELLSAQIAQEKENRA